ncbi:hypothetical protein Mgra_00004902 [Meloidogyne graminicola]|uniref:valine--tRNA ligase n=1 Tax=Meloidogyne graminicola TaxID=189291 RepID=A0A8S9ZR83_9BILA|nr:hypothetical protein Mgra_00004902 [Meloidogyne graminicola]
MSCSLDWEQLFYTMDELIFSGMLSGMCWNKTFLKNFSNAVKTAFCQLYELGLIKRETRLIQSFNETEPSMKEQWFLQMTEINKELLEYLENGNLNLDPNSVRGNLIEFLKFEEPWCLSRQLIWGHKIPAYFVENSKRWIVALTEEDARKQLEPSEIGSKLIQDSDVLDTWFSSSLIPIIIGGWPKNIISKNVINLMETGHDIIGFWVARMLVICKRLTGHYPFSNVLIHGLIRDSQNRKMSKSLGNVVDPMDIINGIKLEQMINRMKNSNLPVEDMVFSETSEKDLRKRFPNGIIACGSDALRFSMLRHDVTDFEIQIDIPRFADEGRRFCNKIWNMCKYCERIFNAYKNCLIEEEEEGGINGINYEVKFNENVRDFKIRQGFKRKTLSNYSIILLFYESTKSSLWNLDIKRILAINDTLVETICVVLTLLKTFLPFVSSFLLDCLNLNDEGERRCKYLLNELPKLTDEEYLKIGENFFKKNCFLNNKFQLLLLLMIRVTELFLIIALVTHTFLTLYTKVEESFNTQAIHDFLYLRNNWTKYDHREFPGVVPRTFVGPLAIASLMSPIFVLAQYFGINKLWMFFTARTTLGLCNLFAFCNFCRCVEKRFGNRVALYLRLFTLSQFHFLFYLSRPLPNTFAMFFVLIAFQKWIENKIIFFTFYATIAIFLFRIELILLFGPIILTIIYIGFCTLCCVLCKFKKKKIKRFSIPFDSFMWGRPVWPELEVIEFNIVKNKSHEYGVMPFWWYFTSALPRSLLLTALIAPLSIFAWQKDQKLIIQTIIPAFIFIFLYSFLPHKELRFIMYTIPLLNLSAAFFCDFVYMETFFYEYFLPYTFTFIISSYIYKLFLTIQFVNVSTRNYPGGDSLLELQFQTRNLSNKPIRVHIDNYSAQTGISRFVQLYDAWEYNKTEDLSLEELQSFDFLMFGVDNLNQFYNDLKSNYMPFKHEEFMRIDGFDKIIWQEVPFLEWYTTFIKSVPYPIFNVKVVHY